MNKLLFTVILVITAYSALFSQTLRKITYVSDDNPSGYFQVFIINEDGTGKKQLTDMSTHCYFPSLSHDGNKVIFNTDDGRIFYIDNINNEQPDDPYYFFAGEHAKFALDDRTIFFNSDFEGVLTIYAMEIGESEPYLVSDLGYSNQQVLSKDNSKIVFSAFYQGGKDVILIDFNDTTDNNIYQISNNNDANLLPDISYDNMLVTWAAFDNNLQGSIMLLKDGNVSKLSKGIQSANRPKFSPDGSIVSFIAIMESKTKINTVDINGSNKKSFDIKGGNIANYIWFDNERILYDAEDGSDYQIGLLDITTGKSRLLTSKGSSMHPFAN